MNNIEKIKNNTSILNKDARIGIVNRGEAAVRFIRGVKEFNNLYNTNLKTVAFYLNIETEAPFVKYADISVPLSSFSLFSENTTPYLNRELMVQALKETDCSAVWVGWGFLAEDSLFVEMLEKEGFIFLGPSSKSMALLGDKIKAKELAEKVGVPILPWSKKPVKDLKEAYEIGEKIGYPIIIKAANAGGGRGIRFVFNKQDLERQFKSARDETIRITGDDIIFIEKLVRIGRHLEVQVLADRHGNVRTFGVRDCSIQRKNQKVIEETPPPNLSQEKIKEIEESAKKLIKAANYESAGTVEFLYDIEDEKFYFMEVNTRLQVEHPITEQLYNIDLVKEQLRIAMGEKLEENHYFPRGWSIEARLNAEDPEKDFIPAPGKVIYYSIPSGPGIRIDSGVEKNTIIPNQFDSMIAKIIAYGNSREEAISRLERALNEIKIKIEGGTTNKAFLLELLKHTAIRKTNVHTKYLEEILKEKENIIKKEDWDIALISVAIEQYAKRYLEELLNFKQQIGSAGYPRNISSSEGYQINIMLKGNPYKFLVKAVGNNIFHIEIDKKTIVAQYIWKNEESVLICKNKRYNIQIVERGDVLQCEVNGIPYFIELESQGIVKSPSPAMVLNVNVKPGQKIKKDDILITLEAMKMEMLVNAPCDGIVKEIYVREGEQVPAGKSLISLDTADNTKKDESSKKENRINFERLIAKEDEEIFEILERDYLSVFLGYDHINKPSKILSQIIDFVKKNEKFKERFIKTLVKGLEIYVSTENLFSKKRIYNECLANEVNFQELLAHFFKRVIDKEKGLPEEFIKSLEEAIKWYQLKNLDKNERYNRALYRIYRSHGSIKEKNELLKSTLFILSDYPEISNINGKLYNLLDDIIQLTQYNDQSIADASFQARYKLFDQKYLQKLTNERKQKIDKLINIITNPSKNGYKKDKLIEDIIDSSTVSIVKDLTNIFIKGNDYQKGIVLELLGKRYNRDRIFIEDKFIKNNIYFIKTKDNKEKIFGTTIGILDNNTQGLEELIKNIPLLENEEKENETIILINVPNKYTKEEENKIYKEIQEILDRIDNKKIKWISLGIVFENDIIYRTYEKGNNKKFEENLLKKYIDPLFYRELKIYRWANFNTTILYRSEYICLILAQSKENPKDERMVAFVDVPLTRAEINEDGTIKRIVLLEDNFMEAIHCLRAEQSKRKKRLFWNRIIIHLRELLHTNLNQIRKYACKLAPRIEELGLEKLVIYGKRPSKLGKNEKIEILFENISGTQFTLRWRKPVEDLIKPMDKYISKVVRARQRKTLYPYEIIKMITQKGYTDQQHFPRGDFEEFDIEVDPNTGEQKIISVANREYGKNKGNIVFGIITNYDKNFPYGLKRVIILADPTVDMGALAEEECRRVIAAIDLAEQRKLPIDWIPISAGARIDMNSGTENLDWTARVLKRIIEFTQAGGEINIIVAGINVGAQSYWNAEATMLMHTKGVLIMTNNSAMLLTGKKALDFSGSVSAEDNIGIGGVERIMGPNGEAQVWVKDFPSAYKSLLTHYSFTYVEPGNIFPRRQETKDPFDRDITLMPYEDKLNQGFKTIGDIFSKELNPDRKKPFDMRQVMLALKDQDKGYFERWKPMKDAETAIVWETRLGGFSIGLIGIESRPLKRIGHIPNDGPDVWSGGTLFPMSSKKVARAINSFSNKLPVVILANLSGFDGSPESLRNCQLEFGAEIGRAVVNFKGPIIFVVVARYHGGAYVVFSRTLNPFLTTIALEGTYASVIGGAPAAAVVFPRLVLKDTLSDKRVKEAEQLLKENKITQKEYNDIYQKVYSEKQTQLGQKFDKIHCVERAKKVGSIHEIISPKTLRPYLINKIQSEIQRYLEYNKKIKIA